MMPKRAPRIHQALWNRHKREIIAVFLAPKSSLNRTREYMRNKYGFNASIKQYTTQLKHWGIGKNTKASKWKYTCYKLRERELQGKPSAVLKHDRKLDDKTVQKETSRNVSLTDMSTMDLDEDIPTPSDIQIVTPPPTNDELLCMRVRVDNLPWIQFKLEVQSIGIIIFIQWLGLRLI
ncbi:hypothetical protein ASPWEDRAFT_37993 [Aspergillus wentii DTO 134E9]|uniref:Clr5 domain-containing protein n=1 Tax=Aspergillus wentii DTO 134E9 TaxID=1073089 RepID=A0A1L9RND7_ASPWE|nr:uncharacterized protein ASPWEDRAFT_37993 [Aspergillus wentii DTO 134E9]OJJ36424.1 hypothetical protein ASPWEDRAFT_37993 [Aspergillus wentii DTO 134E9]